MRSLKDLDAESRAAVKDSLRTFLFGLFDLQHDIYKYDHEYDM